MAAPPIQRSIWLLGDPVSHSVSPQLHNRVYQQLGLPYTYLLARVSKESIKAGLEALATLGAAGANLTIPHKQSVIPLLESLSPAATAIGAVNCIRPSSSTGGWQGHNTDAQGWLDSWHEEIAQTLTGRRCIVLGSGGTSRSIVWALGQSGVEEIHLLARDPSKFQALAEGPGCKTAGLEKFPTLLEENCVVINCTSVGMLPNIESSPVAWPEQTPANLVAADVIYNPSETKFLREAATRGARTLNGCGMLVHQALRAMDFFTQQDVSTKCDSKKLVDLLLSHLSQ